LKSKIKKINNVKNSFFHGVMFHHVHDGKKYLKSYGSISKNKFEKIIKYIGKENILTPDEFVQGYYLKSLKKNNVCLTFDDGLKCHKDIVLKILEKHNLKGLFFVYTSIFDKNPNFFGCFSEFTSKYYKNIDLFYKDFFSTLHNYFLKINISSFLNKNKKKILKIKKIYSFYSIQDIKFRLIRDYFLNPIQYEKLIIKMYKKKKFKYKKFMKKIYLSKKDIKNMSKKGHSFGLHSHDHSTTLDNKTMKYQLNDFKKNYSILKKITKIDPIFSSYPLGRYNRNSINVQKKLNIKMSFRANNKKNNLILSKKINGSKFEISRLDCNKIKIN